MVSKKANWKAPLLVGGTGLLGGISTYAIARALGLGKGWSTALAIPAGVATSVGVDNVAGKLVEDRTAGIREDLEAANRRAVNANQRAGKLASAYSRLAANATHGPGIHEDEWRLIGDLMNDEPGLVKKLRNLYEYRNRLHDQGMNADVHGGTN